MEIKQAVQDFSVIFFDCGGQKKARFFCLFVCFPSPKFAIQLYFIFFFNIYIVFLFIYFFPFLQITRIGRIANCLSR